MPDTDSGVYKCFLNWPESLDWLRILLSTGKEHLLSSYFDQVAIFFTKGAYVRQTSESKETHDNTHSIIHSTEWIKDVFVYIYLKKSVGSLYLVWGSTFEFAWACLEFTSSIYRDLGLKPGPLVFKYSCYSVHSSKFWYFLLSIPRLPFHPKKKKKMWIRWLLLALSL